jgi:hypothetical protein
LVIVPSMSMSIAFTINPDAHSSSARLVMFSQADTVLGYLNIDGFDLVLVKVRVVN